MQVNTSGVSRRRVPAWFCILTAFAFVGMMVVLPGCDPCQNAERRGEVDDGDPCTDDVCSNGTDAEGNAVAVITHDTACPGQVCLDDGTCVDCETDADCGALQVCEANECVDVECKADTDCDDGVFCNGDETCDTATNTCADGTAPDCDGHGCNTDRDACNDCTSNGDCTDDGLFCTGDEECGTDGLCASSGDPCAAGEVCIEDADTCGECATDSDCAADEECDTSGWTCEPIIECTSNGDCDNGDFCDGTETCDTTGFTCVAGTSPCTAGQTCDEATDTCSDIAGSSFTLTTGTDNLTGGGNADTFDGQLFLSTGVFVQTLNNADQLDGAGGTDTLSAQFNPGAATTTTPSALTDIEIFNLEVTTANPQTLSMVNANGVTTINFNNSATNGGDLTCTNIPVAPSDFGMTNSTEQFTATVTSTALSGSSDSCTLTLSGVTVTGGEPDVVIQPSAAGSGYETINVVSQGGIANEIDSLSDGNGNSFTTLNVSGSQDISIDNNALDTTVTTIDASTATGKVSIDATAAATNVTFTGGSGDDTLDISGTYTTGDSINGGDGTDTLVVAAAEAQVGTTTQSNVSNVETIKTDTVTSGNIDVTKFGAKNLTLSAGAATGNTFTLPTDGTLTVENANPGGSNTLAVSGTDTTGDTLNVTLKNIAWTTNVTASTFETLNIDSITGANSIGGTTTLTATAATDTINVTGSQNMTFTGVVTADVIDANAFTGVLTITAAVANAVQITGGTGADVLRGSTAADIINGGDGNDTIRGDAGADLLTGGSGNDTFNMDNGDTDETVTDTIQDFDAGSSTTTNDSFTYDITSIEAVAAVTDLVDTSANSAAGGAGTYALLGSDGATVANADVVGIIGDYTNAANALANKTSWTITYGAALTNNDAFLVAYTSGSNVRIAVAVDNGGGANSDAIDTLFDIAILQNVSLSNLDSGDFTAQ